jgi:hypothetical protein
MYSALLRRRRRMQRQTATTMTRTKKWATWAVSVMTRWLVTWSCDWYSHRFAQISFLSRCHSSRSSCLLLASASTTSHYIFAPHLCIFVVCIVFTSSPVSLPTVTSFGDTHGRLNLLAPLRILPLCGIISPRRVLIERDLVVRLNIWNGSTDYIIIMIFDIWSSDMPLMRHTWWRFQSHLSRRREFSQWISSWHIVYSRIIYTQMEEEKALEAYMSSPTVTMSIAAIVNPKGTSCFPIYCSVESAERRCTENPLLIFFSQTDRGQEKMHLASGRSLAS